MFLDFHNKFISRVSAEVFCKKTPFWKEIHKKTPVMESFLGQLVYETLVSSCIWFWCTFYYFCKRSKNFQLQALRKKSPYSELFWSAF